MKSLKEKLEKCFDFVINRIACFILGHNIQYFRRGGFPKCKYCKKLFKNK